MYIEVHLIKSNSGVTKIENTGGGDVKHEAALATVTKAVYDHGGGSAYMFFI